MDQLEAGISAEHQIELEVGMTERFDFAIYQVFNQDPDEQLRYEGFKLRARYRFGAKNKYVFDPQAYVEYGGKPDFSEHKIELKLVLTRDMGRLNLALNPMLQFERKGTWECKPEYSAGTSYRIHARLRVGLEARGGRFGHYVGPVVSRGSERLWIALGSGSAIGNVQREKPEFQIRLLVGLSL